MSWLGIFLLAWLLGRCIDLLQRRRRRPAALVYGFGTRQNALLALAHPVALLRAPLVFARPAGGPSAMADPSALRTPLLHMFGLRSDMDDAQIRAALTTRLRAHWYTFDLDALRPQDDPRDAMAFACARLAFSVRAAALLGWLDEATQWHVLGQNALRAQDCFNGWLDYGTAWARGRQQWVARARADSLGVSFSEAQVEAWVADAAHPWHQQPWFMAAD
ncbi:MAG: hypothetical protein JWP29_1751 [Rhodoferax sp.]|nr:hypothetical protein [Rhodoferax sp.]